MATIHTECGDIEVSAPEMALYNALAAERTRVYTKAELCDALDTSSPRVVDATAARLRHHISAATGLRMVVNVWGVGFKLEDR